MDIKGLSYAYSVSPTFLVALVEPLKKKQKMNFIDDELCDCITHLKVKCCTNEDLVREYG